MRTIRFLLEKEFRQIFRNKTLLFIIMMVPIVQLIILPLAANYEVKDIALVVVNKDHSAYADRLVRKISASPNFELVATGHSYRSALAYIESGEADFVLEIPAGFEKNLVSQNRETLFVAANAINGVEAGLGSAYLNAIIADFNQQIQLAWIKPESQASRPVIDVVAINWYNPHLRYQLFMVPGILAILVTMIGGYVAALNIVKEKEMGTIEQINVSPIRKHHFIIGKLIPFWILGLVTFSMGLLVAWIVYGVVPVGSIALLYFFAGLYLIPVLGLGLLISTYSETQQQAMFISFFFVMIFILMSGLFTPIESMPGWAQVVSRLNPVTYFIEVMRMVVLKGSGLRDIQYQIAAVTIFGIVLNVWAVVNYKKTT